MEQFFSSALPFLDSIPAIRAILGVILVFFLPGFTWTLVLFKQINVIERIALSIGLSIAMVALVIIALNVLFGIKITGGNSLLIIIVLTVIPLPFYYLKRLAGDNSSE
ncbi:DUF1616 domain-containing protein [Chloroflexota bacterium]